MDLTECEGTLENKDKIKLECELGYEQVQPKTEYITSEINANLCNLSSRDKVFVKVESNFNCPVELKYDADDDTFFFKEIDNEDLTIPSQEFNSEPFKDTKMEITDVTAIKDAVVGSDGTKCFSGLFSLGNMNLVEEPTVVEVKPESIKNEIIEILDDDEDETPNICQHNLTENSEVENSKETTQETYFNSDQDSDIEIKEEIEPKRERTLKSKEDAAGNSKNISTKYATKFILLLQCNQCSFETNIFSTLKYHFYRSHHVKPTTKISTKMYTQIFGCQICKKLFKLKQHLFSHYLSEHQNEKQAWEGCISVKILKCPKCPYQTIGQYDLSQHFSKHKNIYECSICTYKSGDKRRFNSHVRNHYLFEQVEAECKICKETFGGKSELDYHYITKHKSDSDVWQNIITEKIRKCAKCSFYTGSYADFQNHLLSHKNVKSDTIYQCINCDFKTTLKQNLTAHLREKPKCMKKSRVCKICHKSFKKKGSIDNHYVTMHANDSDVWRGSITHKIRKCPKCPYQSVCVNKKHRLTHEEVKFFCEICRKAFTKERELENHYVCSHKKASYIWKNKVTCDIYKCRKCVFQTTFPSVFATHLHKHEEPEKKER